MATISIKVIDAIELEEVEVFGKQDPYVIIKSDFEEKKTVVHNNGGRNPRWNYEDVIRCRDVYSKLEFVIMDKNGISSDKLIGTASYMVHKIMHKEEHTLAVTTAKGKEKGKLNVILERLR